MDRINVSSELVKKYLNKAFEEGWSGYKDLGESVCEKLLDDLIEEVKIEVMKSLNHDGITGTSYVFRAGDYLTTNTTSQFWTTSTNI